MLSRRYKQVIQAIFPLVVALCANLGISQQANAEIATLFSTPQERKIIDANRYKSDTVVRVQAIGDSDEDEDEDRDEMVQREFTVSYVVSGITLSSSGPNYAWINNAVYEDGQRLEDNSQIKVMSGSKLQIRITTPDGKIYYANSGETIDVTYIATVVNE
jgi:hypothetical protein